MLQESGIHQSYDKPPEVPPFTESRPKRQKTSTSTSTSSCGETFVQLAEAFTTVMTRPQQAEKNTAEHAATKEKPANVSYYCINRDRIVTIIRKVAYDWVLILPEEKKNHAIARDNCFPRAI